MTLYISKNNQQLGPYTIAEAQALVANGTLQATDWAWYEGVTDWIPLQQIPGYTTAPATGNAVAATPTATTGPVRRPVLVWIICLLYFITTPFALVCIVGLPYLLPILAKTQQQAANNIQSQIDNTTDPAQKDRLIALEKQLTDNQAQMSNLNNYGMAYYAFMSVLMIVNLIAAIFLFLLRRIAFYLFAAMFVIGIFNSIYTYVFVGFPHASGAAGAMGMVIGITVNVIVWAINIAILFYIWTLFRKGVLR